MSWFSEGYRSLCIFWAVFTCLYACHRALSRVIQDHHCPLDFLFTGILAASYQQISSSCDSWVSPDPFLGLAGCHQNWQSADSHCRHFLTFNQHFPFNAVSMYSFQLIFMYVYSFMPLMIWPVFLQDCFVWIDCGRKLFPLTQVRQEG